jgi:MtN3/saliva family.
MNLITLIGLLANAHSLVQWFPQARNLWKYRHEAQSTKAVSLTSIIIALSGTTVWFIYGLLKHDFWLAIGFVFIAPTTLFSLVLTVKSRRGDK